MCFRWVSSGVLGWDIFNCTVMCLDIAAHVCARKSLPVKVKQTDKLFLDLSYGISNQPIVLTLVLGAGWALYGFKGYILLK